VPAIEGSAHNQKLALKEAEGGMPMMASIAMRKTTPVSGMIGSRCL